MVSPLQGHAPDASDRVTFHHAVRRRLSLAGVPELFRTHQIFGGTAMAVADIDTNVQFPIRTTPVTFKTSIRILANAGVHRGLVFELGGSGTGTALWVEDEKIGFHAGEDGTVNGATALFDFANELTVGAEFELIVAARPGDGRVIMWSHGNELARSAASSGGFGGGNQWAGIDNGSFAAAPQSAILPDVPAASQIAPDGFEVIEPLSIYIGQVPRHFV